MTPRAARRLSVSLAAASLGLMVAGEALLVVNVTAPAAVPRPYSLIAEVQALGGLAFVAVGALIAGRHPRNPVGWLFSAAALALALHTLAEEYAVAALRAPALPGARFAGWLSVVVLGLFVAPLALLLHVFPSGRVLSRRWRPLLEATALGAALMIVGTAIQPGELPTYFPARNPLGVDSPLVGVVRAVSTVLLLGGTAGGVGALLVRLRRGQAVERQQIKWVVWSAAVVFVALLLATALWPEPMEGTLGEVLWGLGSSALPVSAGLAMLRFRLYDIDRIINRTAVYAVLSGLLAVTYVATVTVLQAALAPFAGQSQLAVAGSTLAVATLFRPLRERVQAAVDRRFNRARYDAARTLAGYRHRLRDELDLDAVASELVTAVHATVQPASASLWLRPWRVRP